MASRIPEDVSVLLRDGKWLEDFGIDDTTILLDILQLGKTDVNKLLLRLSNTAEHVCSVRPPRSYSTDYIQTYVHCVVCVYCSCLNNIKVARLVEKIWQPWMQSHHALFTREFEQYVNTIISSQSIDLTDVTSLSLLLEKNTVVRGLIQNDLCPLLSWMMKAIEKYMELPSADLSKNQMQCLYYVIKIGLQIFQQHGAQFNSVWGNIVHSGEATETGSLPDTVWSAVRQMVNLLASKNYSTDCCLMTGSALALFLNTCPDHELAVSLFYSLYQMVASPGDTVDMKIIPHQVISREITFDSCMDTKNIGCLSLLNGIIACGSDKILHYSHDKLFYLQLFHQVVSLCEGPVTLHYHAFHLLLLWYKKLKKVLKDLRKKKLSPEILLHMFKNTLLLIWRNWGSPVEDVPEIVTDVFRSLMDTADMISVSSEMAEMVLSKLKMTPWFVKGKYRILSVLLQFTDIEQMMRELPEMQTTLLHCLSNSSLAPVAANVYKAFVLEIKKTRNAEAGAAVWEKVWLEAVLSGLTSHDSLVRSNTSKYLLSQSVKCLPQTSDMVQNALESKLEGNKQASDRPRVLCAWLALSQIRRNTSSVFSMKLEYVWESLYSEDEEIRSNAFSLICNTLRKAEPLSKDECKLLMETIPFNMKVDSAPFRQQLTRDLHNLLVRLRDSSLAALRDGKTELLDFSVDFLDWFHKLLIENLLPGASYQRRKASLDLLSVLYDTLIYRPDVRHRKDFPPESSQQLLAYCQRRNLLPLYSPGSMSALLYCVLDTADLIQAAACSLLMTHHKWPILLDGNQGDMSGQSTICHLLREILRLCNSPKTHESTGGALLCRLVFNKYMLELNWSFSIEYRSEESEFTVSVTDSKYPASTFTFMNFLLQQLEQSLIETKSNILSVSKSQPMYGFVNALTLCLTNMPHSTEGLADIVKNFVSVNINIIQTTLSLMGADSVHCPSFAEMNTALEGVLDESTEDVLYSTDFQYLLSWCWKNIKGSCLSLGELTSFCLKSETSDILLDMTATQRISDTFLTVLTQCRHKGVIEGCRTAFLKFCTCLFSSANTDLNGLPRQILEQVLSSIQQEERLTKSSVTRKSAGLPVIVQCVLVSEMRSQKSTLLGQTLDKLFEVSVATVEDVKDDKQDLMQVHGLNILKALFSESSFSSIIIQYISRASVLVIEKFGSPYWAVRNAATRLFSTLVTKIFGQKSGADKNWNTVTLQEFSSYYPELTPLILKILDEALVTDLYAIDKLHPSLFPVLTLLGNLGIQEANQLQESLMKELYSKLEKLLGSPVYNLRHLVASACVAMVPVQKVADVTRTLLRSLVSPGSHICSNMLHGKLIFLELLLHNQMFSLKEASDLSTQILHLGHTFQADTCCLVLAKHLDIVIWLQRKCCPGVPNVQKLVSRSMERDRLGSILNVGYSMYIERLVAVRLSLYDNDNPLREDIKQILQSTELENRKSAILFLETLLKADDKTADFWTDIQLDLCKLTLAEPYQPLLVQCLNLIVAICLQKGVHAEVRPLLQEWVNSKRETTPPAGIMSGLMLPILGICWQNHNLRDTGRVEDWCTQLVAASDTSQNENMRTAAAQALILAGRTVLEHSSQVRGRCLEQSVTKIFIASFNQILEDDIVIRKLGVEFVSQIVSTEYKNIHSNICFKKLCEYISSMFWWSESCVLFLANRLYLPKDIQTDIQAVTNRSCQSLFDQDDNSFFAEKIYNNFTIHQALQLCLKESLDNGQSDHLKVLSSFVSTLCEDLDFLLQHIRLHCTDKPIINLATDSKVLGSICGLRLLGDIILNVFNKTALTPDRELTALHERMSVFKKADVLPAVFVTMLEETVTPTPDQATSVS